MIEAPEGDVFHVITDFLAADPTDEELLAFKFPDDLQKRVHHLLDLNGEGELTCEQRHELDDFIRANRMITTMKIRTELRMRGLEA